MQQAPSSMLSVPSGFWWTAALAFFMVILAPALAFFAGRGQAAAQAQGALNDAFRALASELQSERSALIARIAALEGENRQLHQIADSMENLLRRNGIEVPDRWKPSSDQIVVKTLKASKNIASVPESEN